MPTVLRVPTFKPNKILVTCADGVKRWVEYTDEHVRQAISNGNAQLKAGLRAPVCWGHDVEAKPAYLSNESLRDEPSNPHKWMSQKYIADPVRWEYDPRTREAVAICEFPRQAEADQFQAVGQVSPAVVFNYQDERGKTWPGCSILHIASTPKPKQRDVSRVTVAKKGDRPITAPAPSYRAGFLSHPPSGAVYLSFDSDIRREPMAKEDVEVEVEGDGDAASIKDFVKILKDLGAHVGDPKTMGELLIAAKAARDTKMGGAVMDDMPTDLPMDTGAGDGEDTTDDANEPAGGAPLFMSWTPTQLAFCEREAKFNERDWTAQAKALGTNGQVDVATSKRLVADLTRVNLGHEPHRHFTKDFKFKVPAVVREIEAYAKLPHGRFSVENVEKGNARAQHLGHKPTPTVPDLGQSQPTKSPDGFPQTPEEFREWLANKNGVKSDGAKA